MITFLVVGRNDYYGINLHKRTALSLNYFGSLCENKTDEIIYVDCNTPAHELSLVEAIADTLTPITRRHLRIFRVSGEQMLAAIGETPLPFSDELSRNVGIRRSNPANRWLLSTNSDIIVLPDRCPIADIRARTARTEVLPLPAHWHPRRSMAATRSGKRRTNDRALRGDHSARRAPST